MRENKGPSKNFTIKFHPGWFARSVIYLYLANIPLKEIMNELNRKSDPELVRGFRDGDKNCLGELFRRYLHLAFGVALKYLRDPEASQDAVMQVFEKLHKDLHYHDVRNFSSWLHVVVRNQCLMDLRKKKGIFSMPIEQAEFRPGFMENSAAFHPEDSLQKEERIVRLEEAIQHLNSEQKICIELFYLKGLSYKEICTQTGYTLLQIKSHIQNGKRNLKISLEKHHEQ